MTQCRISVMHQTDDVISGEIGLQTPQRDVIRHDREFVNEVGVYFGNQLNQHMKEEQGSGRSNGWQLTLSPQGSELMCKKVGKNIIINLKICYIL